MAAHLFAAGLHRSVLHDELDCAGDQAFRRSDDIELASSHVESCGQVVDELFESSVRAGRVPRRRAHRVNDGLLAEEGDVAVVQVPLRRHLLVSQALQDELDESQEVGCLSEAELAWVLAKRVFDRPSSFPPSRT